MEARRETWETREHTARGDNITKNRRKKTIYTREEIWAKWTHLENTGEQNLTNEEREAKLK